MAISRYLSFVQLAGWLLFVMLGINVGLHFLSATPVLGWLPNVVSGRGFFEDNRQRVADASREYREGRVSSEQPLCVIVGLSNMREGIDLSILAARTGSKCRFLGLGAAGIGMPGVVEQAELVLASDLKPDLVIVGIGPHQLVEIPVKHSSHVARGLLDYLRTGDLRNAAMEVRNWLWFFTRRKDVGITVENALLDARAGLLEAFNVRIVQEGDGHRSPWREIIRSDMPEHFSKATLDEEMQFFEGLGVFNMETYARSPRPMATLITLVKQFRTRGTEVVILLLPEHSALRKRMPPNLLDAIDDPLKLAFKEKLPLVEDFRTKVDDSGFVDLGHLNTKGREHLSSLLAERIPGYLDLHRPPPGK